MVAELKRCDSHDWLHLRHASCHVGAVTVGHVVMDAIFWTRTPLLATHPFAAGGLRAGLSAPCCVRAQEIVYALCFKLDVKARFFQIKRRKHGASAKPTPIPRQPMAQPLPAVQDGPDQLLNL